MSLNPECEWPEDPRLWLCNSCTTDLAESLLPVLTNNTQPKNHDMIYPTIGLFGTCGNSRWREPFIQDYKTRGIQFFNPQVDNWTPKNAELEAKHLANDEIILFPITSETYGGGSLAEVSVAALNTVKFNQNRAVVVLIDTNIDEALKAEPTAANESLRARALMREHIKNLNLANVYFVETFTEMLEVSIQLHEVATVLAKLRTYSTAKND